MKSGKKILVAMSGGVDSSVAACLLAEQGHDVVGVFMRLGAGNASASVAVGADAARRDACVSLPLVADESAGSNGRQRGCCSAADATDARLVAGQLGIPFYVLNFADEFSRLKRYFADEYAAARTPNPCVMCNQWLKFGRLFDYAAAVDADEIATGHYARVDHSGDAPRLLRARDARKDQSYVLFGLSASILRRTRFPLGELTKDEVRAAARRFGLAIHDKPESQDICFVPDGDYARVVRTIRPDAFAAGEVRHADGRLLGSHDGVANFTIGQRRGLGISLGEPAYVSALDAVSGAVTIGPAEAVKSDRAVASGVSWISIPPCEPFRAEARIRYNHVAAPALVAPASGDRVEVLFDEPQWAVTPGQALVIYCGDEVLGGGWLGG